MNMFFLIHLVHLIELYVNGNQPKISRLKVAEIHIVHIPMFHVCRPPHKVLVLISRRQTKAKQTTPVRKKGKS